jgi:hypothetical protein
MNFMKIFFFFFLIKWKNYNKFFDDNEFERCLKFFIDEFNYKKIVGKNFLFFFYQSVIGKII